MSIKSSFLFATTAFTAAISMTAPAFAADADQAPAAGGAGQRLEEVVVTATRQSQTANRVALSIAAVTQRNLDQQGIKSANDLTQSVPALVLVPQVGQTGGAPVGVGTFIIRGIVATVGASTTGVYLDDTSLTKRANPGGAQLNGAPLPILFDLDRLEVLKGPQGTLYGGSSEGGTIRFITPTPSLTQSSGFARTEFNTVDHGGIGDELGAAWGGPIIQDKLGVRVSGILRNTAGWIDRLNPYTSTVYDPDANRRREWAMRGALRWQISPDLQATVSAYHSDFWSPGGSDSTTVVFGPNGQPAPNQVYTSSPLCFNNNGRAATNGAGPAAVACPAGPLPAGWYQRPSYTYGPYNFGLYQSIQPLTPRPEEQTTANDVYALTLDYQFRGLSLKSVTSYIHDRTTGKQDEGYDILRTQQTLQVPGKIGFPLWAGDPLYSGIFDSVNHREGIEQEFRVASPTDKRLTFVGGLFISNVQTHIDWQAKGNYNADYLAFVGLTATQRYGGQTFATPNVMSELHATLTDTELAGFGEANLRVWKGLKLTAGVRISQEGFHFQQANYGFYNVGRNFLTSPGAYIDGRIDTTPVTPKFGAEYDFAADKLVYFTASKGFRPGGLNAPLNPACAPGLALYGLTVADIPTTYQQDSVWSYEAGGKFRLLDGRMQLNTAAYRIDWSNIQVTQAVQGCPGWNQNGGTATSQGFDLQTDFRPIDGLTVSVSTGYDDAHYTSPVLGPVSPTQTQKIVAYNTGDPLGVPTWQGNLGVRYDFQLRDTPTYVRADYNFTGAYTQGPSFGTLSYAAFSRRVGGTNVTNVRAGVQLKSVDVNIYVQNLFNSHQQIGNAGNGIASCQAAGGPACSAYSGFNPYVQEILQRPRLMGVQANYRF